jgi:protein TonB
MTKEDRKVLNARQLPLLMVSAWTRARHALEGRTDRTGQRQDNQAGCAQTAMTKALGLSLLFHGAIVIAMILCFGGKPARHQETITVFLSDEEPSGLSAPRKAGTPGGAAILGTPEAASRASARKTQNETHFPQSLPSPPPPVPIRETVREKTAAPEETNVALDGAGPPAPARSPLAGSPGNAGGTGSGASGGEMGRSVGRAPGGGGNFATGSGTGAGEGQPRYLREHYAYIKEIINRNLQYPPVARRMGLQGAVQITFIVLENGFAESVRITRSSGHALLDQAVVKAVRRVQPFPRPPARAELTVPVVFRLENGA